MVMMMKTTQAPISDAEYLRRCATSALIDAICQTSPAQAALRDAGRRHSELMRRLLELGSAGDPSISDELIACNERLIAVLGLARLPGAVISCFGQRPRWPSCEQGGQGREFGRLGNLAIKKKKAKTLCYRKHLRQTSQSNLHQGGQGCQLSLPGHLALF
jgi:hypothetical protein